MHIYLQTAAAPDTPPRFYHLFLQEDLIAGWTLVKESGQQGASGRVTKQHFDSREAAETAMISARDAQLKRGYRVVFVRGEQRPG